MDALLLEEFGIDQYGGNIEERVIEKKKKEKETRLVDFYEDENGYFVKSSSFDFVQEIARVSGREQNAILKMCIDLVRRECHTNRTPGGDVEESLILISSRWERFCDQCDRLKIYVELEREAKKNADAEREERLRKRKDKRLNRIMKNKGEEEEEEEEIVENVYLKHKGFGSPLMMNANKTAYSLFLDTENIRRALIWCLMCHSVAVQRLIRCGKFYSDRYKVRLRYAPIRQDTLEEFVHWIDPLKNAFYTCQMSASNFVDIVRCMVEQGGVNHYVNVVLNVARVLETRRIEKISRELSWK